MSWVDFGHRIRAGHQGKAPALYNARHYRLSSTADFRYFRKQSSTPSSPHPPQPSPPVAPSSSGHSGGKISPVLLIVFVTVAALLFASALLHLLIRYLNRRRRGSSSGSSADPSAPSRRRRWRSSPASPSAIQRQLQQLFTLHDGGGLDQASIDALPAFVYTELKGIGGVAVAGDAAAEGPGEPLDCAVCLCEFFPTDRLRLIPACGHAFHLACIDAWLTSSSTCPLCRGAAMISLPDGLGAAFDLDDYDWRDLEEVDSIVGDDDEEKVVFPVRLGKFRSLQAGAAAVVKQGPLANANDDNANSGRHITTGNERQSTSSSTTTTTTVGNSSRMIDERRCYSMGSYQYVLQDSALRLAISSVGRDGWQGSRRRAASVVVSGGGTGAGGVEGRRLSVVGKGESFSVSKIWQWSNKKGQYPFPAVPSNAAPIVTRELQ